MKNNVIWVCLFLTGFFFSAKAQQGKDGVGNITVANTVVNIYTPLTVSVTAGSSNITVGSAASFSVGDLIYIIQMQGATVNAYTYMWGDPNSALPNDTSQGKVKSYNDAGNNEFAQVTSISGNVITLDCGLKNKYGDSLLGVPKTQVIRVPRYSSLTLSSPGTITCPAWNGLTGGVVVVEVQGNTTIGAGSSIDASGKGFRGGGILNATGFTATNVGSNYNSPGTNNGAHKGESIVGDTNVYKRQNNGNFDWTNQFWLSTPLTINKGNVANGGGGGNANNCGGGGGSNGGVVNLWNGMGNPDNSGTNATSWSRESAAPVNGSFRPTSSSGGGRGGYAYSANNSDPTLAGNGPGGGTWGGDSRHNDGGWGGTPLDYSGGKIFLGGGGGAGDSNDGNGTAGGNGGGIVYLVSYGTVTGAGQITANGATAVSTNWASTTFDEAFALGDDGAGGGGGGGAVLIKSSGAITLTNPTPIVAQGGVGGDVHSHNTGSTNKNFGPGGGGGGGYVATSNAVTSNVSGGANGTVFLGGGNNTKIAQNFKPNGATAGGAGTSATSTTFYLTSTNYTICAGSSASLTVTSNGTGIPGSLTYNWYNTSSGGNPVFTGNPYNTGALTVGTYTYYAGTCPGTYRIPVVVTVLTSPTITITPANATVCSGTTVTLTASGASTYTWSSNAGSVTTPTASVNPSSNTTYTVTGTTGSCPNITQTVTVNASPIPTVTVNSPTVCSGTSATLTANGATTYSWTPSTGLSATTGSVVTSGSASTITYTVTGTSGSCSAAATSTVTVIAIPTVTVNSATICSGTSATLTANGAATYSWTPSTGLSATTGSVVTSTAASTSTYTVTGTSGSCSAAATSTVTVNPTPTVTVNSATICSGTSATLTANGATTYSWTPSTGLSATTGSVVTSNSASTITYTVTGTTGSCSGTNTSTVTVNPTPTVVVNNATICPGNSATLTATGATTYSWTPATDLSASSGTSVVATPTATSTYTIVGTSGSCSGSTTATVTVAGSLIIAVNSSTICSGYSGTLTATGASTYTWSPAGGLSSTSGSPVVANPTTTTVYTVSGSSGSCSATATSTVTVNATPVVSAIATSTVICKGGSTTLNAGGAATYTWSTNSNATSISVSPTTNATYTVIGTANGCNDTNTVTVNVTPLPSLTITATPAAICAGQSSSLSGSGATTYTWSTGTSSNPISVSPLSNTSYTLAGTQNGCSDSTVISITVTSMPSLTVSPTSATICSGTAVTFTASGAGTYTWSANAGSAATATVSVSPVATDTYTVTGDNGGGCTATQTVSINVTATPTVSAVASNTAICNGSGATLTASGASTYTWSANAGSVTTATAAVTPTVTTIYTVTGENPGCTATQTVSVLVNALPDASASTTGTISCGGGTATVNGNSTTGGVTYSWSGPGILSGGSTAVATVNLQGIYTLTVMDPSTGCNDTATTSVTTDTAVPNATASATGTISCLNLSATISGNSTTSGVTYAWSGPGGFTSASANNTVTASGTYTLTVTNAGGGCNNVALAIVNSDTVKPNVTTNATGIIKCSGPSTATVDASSSTGGVTYNWNGPGVVSGGSNDTAIVNISGVYTVTATDPANGCASTATVSPANASGPTNANVNQLTADTCNRSTGSLSITNVVGGTPGYVYSLNGDPAQSSNVFAGLASGHYQVLITDTNGCMWTNLDSVNSFGPSAVPTIAGGPTTFCQGGSVILTSSSASGNTWSNGATTQTITVNATDTVSLIVSQSGCSLNSNTVIVTVNPNPTVTTNILNSPIVCSGTTATLTASGATNYTWSTNAGSATTATVSVSPATSGTITTTVVYTVVGTDGNGCSDVSTVTATVSPTAAPPNLPDTIYYCLFQNALPLHAVPSGGATTVVWTINGMSVADSTIVPATSPTGITTYYAQQGGGGICFGALDSVKVIVIAQPDANFTTDPTSGNVLAGQDVQFTPTQGISSGLTYFWHFDDTNSSVDSSFSYSPAHAYANQGTYCPSLTVYQALTGCRDTKTNCIEILSGVTVTIPNVFTPNDDNINDVFSIKAEGISNLTCSIYDRWGLKLYDWTGVAGFWNGKESKGGKTVSDGTYYYIIEATDVKKVNHKYQGYLQLLR